MLQDSKAFSGFAVNNVEKAKVFYEEILGLPVEKAGMGNLMIHLGSGANVLIYPKPHHTPADYTILNFPTDDIEATVDALAAKGILFEHYEGMKIDGKGIMRGGGPLIAWFKDPAGNILSIIEQK